MNLSSWLFKFHFWHCKQLSFKKKVIELMTVIVNNSMTFLLLYHCQANAFGFWTVSTVVIIIHYRNWSVKIQVQRDLRQIQLVASELHLCGPGIKQQRLLINISASGLHIHEDIILQRAEFYQVLSEKPYFSHIYLPSCATLAHCTIFFYKK